MSDKNRVLDAIYDISRTSDESTADTLYSLFDSSCKATSIMTEYQHDKSVLEMFAIFQEAEDGNENSDENNNNSTSKNDKKEEKPDFSKMSDAEKKAYKEKHPFEEGSVLKTILWFIPNLIGLIVRSIKKCFEKDPPEQTVSEKIVEKIKESPQNIKDFFKNIFKWITEKFKDVQGGENIKKSLEDDKNSTEVVGEVLGFKITKGAIITLFSSAITAFIFSRDCVHNFIKRKLKKDPTQLNYKYTFEYFVEGDKNGIKTNVEFDGLEELGKSLLMYFNKFQDLIATLKGATIDQNTMDEKLKRVNDAFAHIENSSTKCFNGNDVKEYTYRDADLKLKSYKQIISSIQKVMEAIEADLKNIKPEDDKYKAIEKFAESYKKANGTFKEAGEDLNFLSKIYEHMTDYLTGCFNGTQDVLFGKIAEKFSGANADSPIGKFVGWVTKRGQKKLGTNTQQGASDDEINARASEIRQKLTNMLNGTEAYDYISTTGFRVLSHSDDSCYVLIDKKVDLTKVKKVKDETEYNKNKSDIYTKDQNGNMKQINGGLSYDDFKANIGNGSTYYIADDPFKLISAKDRKVNAEGLYKTGYGFTLCQSEHIKYPTVLILINKNNDNIVTPQIRNYLYTDASFFGLANTNNAFYEIKDTSKPTSFADQNEFKKMIDNGGEILYKIKNIEDVITLGVDKKLIEPLSDDEVNDITAFNNDTANKFNESYVDEVSIHDRWYSL